MTFGFIRGWRCVRFSRHWVWYSCWLLNVFAEGGMDVCGIHCFVWWNCRWIYIHASIILHGNRLTRFLFRWKKFFLWNSVIPSYVQRCEFLRIMFMMHLCSFRLLKTICTLWKYLTRFSFTWWSKGTYNDLHNICHVQQRTSIFKSQIMFLITILSYKIYSDFSKEPYV